MSKLKYYTGQVYTPVKVSPELHVKALTGALNRAEFNVTKFLKDKTNPKPKDLKALEDEVKRLKNKIKKFIKSNAKK
jgi:Na+/phosphate symporter